MKKSILTIVLMSLGLTILADDYKYLNVETTDGDVISLDASSLSMSFSDGYLMSGSLHVAALSELNKMYFSNEEGNVSLDEYIITIPSTGVVTMCSEYDRDFSDGNVKAYIVSGCEGQSIWLTRVTDVPAGTPMLLKGEAGDYLIPASTSATYYPENFLRGSATSESHVVPEEDGYVNMYLSTSEGTFVVFTSEADLPAGTCYLHMPVSSFADPITGETQTIEIPSSGKYTYCPSVDLDFTDVDGLKAYIATGIEESGKLWLSKVENVQAGTALFLKGDAGSYSVPSVGGQTEFANLLKGSATESITLSQTTGDYTNYYLNTSGTFVLFGETEVEYPAGRSYLQIPTAFLAGASAGTRSVESAVIGSEEAEVISMEVIFGDGTTGINALKQQTAVEDDVYYNLQGQRVDNPGKGLYIKNGKKVIVR